MFHLEIRFSCFYSERERERDSEREREREIERERGRGRGRERERERERKRKRKRDRERKNTITRMSFFVFLPDDSLSLSFDCHSCFSSWLCSCLIAFQILIYGIPDLQNMVLANSV
jgi:hypothetical protein